MNKFTKMVKVMLLATFAALPPLMAPLSMNMAWAMPETEDASVDRKVPARPVISANSEAEKKCYKKCKGCCKPRSCERISHNLYEEPKRFLECLNNWWKGKGWNHNLALEKLKKNTANAGEKNKAL